MSIVKNSTSAFYDNGLRSMASLRKLAETYQDQISTQKKLARSSDDPVAASRLRNLSRVQLLSGVDTANADRASTDLSLADAAMSDMAAALIRIQELTATAANATTSDADRASIAIEMDTIFGNLVTLANARDSGGNALFGGQSAGDAYMLDPSGQAIYVGTADPEELPLGEGQSVIRSVTGPQIFSFNGTDGNPTDLLTVVKNLADAMKGGASDPQIAARDALAELKAGLDTLATGQTLVGTRLSWIEMTGERRTTLGELRSNEQSDLGSTDLTTAVAQLQETLLVLEATQSTFTKLASLTLFDQLR